MGSVSKGDQALYKGFRLQLTWAACSVMVC